MVTFQKCSSFFRSELVKKIVEMLPVCEQLCTLRFFKTALFTFTAFLSLSLSLLSLIRVPCKVTAISWLVRNLFHNVRHHPREFDCAKQIRFFSLSLPLKGENCFVKNRIRWNPSRIVRIAFLPPFLHFASNLCGKRFRTEQEFDRKQLRLKWSL